VVLLGEVDDRGRIADTGVDRAIKKERKESREIKGSGIGVGYYRVSVFR
jgi:hypothetical protein